MSEDQEMDSDQSLVLTHYTGYIPKNEAERLLLEFSKKLCGRCVNRILNENIQLLSLDAIAAAELVAVHAWVIICQDLATGKLRGPGSREKAYQNLIRSFRNHRVNFAIFQKKQVKAEKRAKYMQVGIKG